MSDPAIEDDGFITVDMHTCPVCHGTGEVACSGTRDGMDYDTTEECPNCSAPLIINGVWRRQF